MFFGGVISGGSGVSVQLPDYGGFGNDDEAPCFSGVRFGSDGKIYRMTSAGAWQWTGETWLNDGSAANYYLKRAVTGDTLTSDAGDLQQMNANLDFYYENNTAGVGNVKDCDILFHICDDTLGSNEIVQNTYELTALVLF